MTIQSAVDAYVRTTKRIVSGVSIRNGLLVGGEWVDWSKVMATINPEG